MPPATAPNLPKREPHAIPSLIAAFNDSRSAWSTAAWASARDFVPLSGGVGAVISIGPESKNPSPKSCPNSVPANIPAMPVGSAPSAGATAAGASARDFVPLSGGFGAGIFIYQYARDRSSAGSAVAIRPSFFPKLR